MISCSFTACLWLLCSTYGFVASYIPPFATKKYAVQRSSFCSHGYFATTSDEEENTLLSGSDGIIDDDLSLAGFQRAKQKIEQQQIEENSPEIDGYYLRDVIVAKWGKSFDVDFNRVDAFGFRELYLNILPFHLGGRQFRHDTELDYLCHLQAVVEILQKHNQLDYVLEQIDGTSKIPRKGGASITAVPLRLKLSREQVQQIIGY